MAQMGFNSEEACNAFNDALLHDDELKDAMDKASKKVADSFGSTGGVIRSSLGKLLESVWGDGTDTYFKLKLVRETEFFLREKVKPIIRTQEGFVNTTSNYYQQTLKEAQNTRE